MSVPSDICSDFREGAAERFSGAGLRSVWQCGAFLGAGDNLGVMLTEDRLRASSDSPSVRPASSLELDSGLLKNTVLLGPLESCDGVRWRSRSSLFFTSAEEAVLEELFCSEECEDRDSMLPMGVLLGLLLKVSPMQGPEKRHAKPSLKPADRIDLYGYLQATTAEIIFTASVLTFCISQAECRRVEAAGLPGTAGHANGSTPARFRPALGLGQGHVGVRGLVEDLEIQAGASITQLQPHNL